MAKKILGNDPFNAPSPSGAATGKKPSGKPTNKIKRAPSRKTEAPLVTAPTTAESPRKRAGAAKKKSVSAMSSATPATATAPAAEAPSAASATSFDAAVASTTTSALQPIVHSDASFDVPPANAAPGSWRWWRYRQVQLARAEEAAWLAHSDGVSRADRFGRDPVVAGRAEPIVDVLYRSWLRVSVRGLGHVPETGRAILVVRRRRPQSAGLRGAAFDRLGRLGFDGSFGSALDAAIIGHAIRTEHVAHREVRPLVRPARLYTPLIGSLLRKLGGVPADPHDFARLLDDDRVALAFVDDPSTPRRHDSLDLSTIVSLALVTGAPIVPVVVGRAPSMTLRERLGLIGGRPSVTAIAFGAPLFPGVEFGADGAEDDALVQRLAGELQAQL